MPATNLTKTSTGSRRWLIEIYPKFQYKYDSASKQNHIIPPTFNNSDNGYINF